MNDSTRGMKPEGLTPSQLDQLVNEYLEGEPLGLPALVRKIEGGVLTAITVKPIPKEK